jgi:hypothetical protein
MKTISSILLLALGLSITSFVQAPARPLDLFNPFLEGEWKIQGGDLGGGEFNQKVKFRRNLDGQIVETESYSFDSEKNWTLRNKGVRYFDKESQAIRFSEWTVFGDVTHGTIVQKRDTIEYQYNYSGMELRDLWIPIHKDTYQFMVGAVKDGKLQNVLLDTKAVRMHD